MKVGIIIPAYKNPKQLEKCQKAIEAQVTDHEVHTFIHDNSKENIGFTEAINKGLLFYNKESFDYCVALNQDCYMEPDCVQNAVEFMESKPKAFIGGVKQIHDQMPDFIIHGGCTEAFPNGRHIVGKVSNGDCERDRQMPWVNGACMFVKMSLLPEVGIMDENYFLLASDSDWCYTARQRHKQVWYIANAVVVHEQGISTKKGKDLKLEYSKYLDMTYFQDKWIGDGEFKELRDEVFR